MNTSIKRTICTFLALVMLCCTLPLTVWAESSDPAATTTTTAAPATVKLDQLRVKGSNNKVYLSTPNLSDGANAYSFGVPNWMETVTITFIGKEGIAATCSNGQAVIAAGTNYSVSMELTENKQTVTLSLKQGDLTRNIDVTVNRRQIDCYIEDIMIYSGDNKITPTSGTAEEGKMTFTLPSGTLNGVKLRVKPRHEGTVTISNVTKKQDGEAITDAEKILLKLNQSSTYYPTDLCDTTSFDKLVEGTNRYYVEVKAGTITRTCDVTVIVGDPNANAPTTTTTTTTTTAPPTTPPTSATAPSVQQNIPGNQSSAASSILGNIPPVLWILIGIIALVVIGSCIFMIVNMSAGNRGRGGYNNYDYDYDYGPQRPRRRRNLTEYLDDEYDDYGYDRGRGGRYDEYDDYDDYDRGPRRGGRYDSYDDYDDYDPPRRSSRYDDYDNYDDGYGGY